MHYRERNSTFTQLGYFLDSLVIPFIVLAFLWSCWVLISGLNMVTTY